ncbi:hypothetical protein V7128_16885 [Neobacillus vireti]|uniref:hypothetical protein n=1 Tax=Neobacillus vireti TaxID=220686 RepID=UPI002FFE99CB
MVRKIKAVSVASDDADFGTHEHEVVLLAEDVVLEQCDDEAIIFILEEAVRDDQDTVQIDRATCERLSVDFLAKETKRGLEWIINASFLQVIRYLAEK